LDFLESRKQRVSGGVVTSNEAELGPQPHVPWLQPYPDGYLDDAAPDTRLLSRERMELGHLVALQRLPRKQRVPAVNAALQRACEALGNKQETGVRTPPGDAGRRAGGAGLRFEPGDTLCLRGLGLRTLRGVALGPTVLVVLCRLGRGSRNEC
jgi:hypothetical protein